MDIGMMHSHKLFVVLYMVLLLLKVVFIATKNKNALTTLNGKTKILHIVLASLMLATGVYLMVKSPIGLTPTLIGKYVVILAAIGLGVVGVKKMNAPMAMLSLAAFIYVFYVSIAGSFTLQNTVRRMKEPHNTASGISNGQYLYETGCAKCHGFDGKANFMKAKDLSVSTLPDEAKAQWIKNGMNSMPAFDYLNDQQVKDLVEYVNTLKVQK